LEHAEEARAAQKFNDVEKYLSESHDLTRANLKMKDPDRNYVMSAKEVMAVLGISKSAVYEHKGLELASTGTKAKRFTAKSVMAIKNSPPD
jgi:hypothetical protein